MILGIRNNFIEYFDFVPLEPETIINISIVFSFLQAKNSLSNMFPADNHKVQL